VSSEEILISIAGSFTVCMFCQWLAWRGRLPAIIFLLMAGIFAGPVLHILDPREILGQLFFPFVSLSVSIILFEGSLTLKFREILGLTKVVRNMLTFGLLITWLITSVATRYLIGISWDLAFLFGAITVVTGPTVIAPLLRTVRPTAAVSNVLRWEGIVIDPIGASLAVIVYEFIISGGGQEGLQNTLLTFAQIVGAGLCTGAVCGYLFGLVLRNHWLPDFLQNVGTLGVVFFSFVLANSLQMESGLVAVTVLGLWLGNMKDVDIEQILEFKENLSVMLISLLFFLLAAQLNVAALSELGLGAALVFAAVQFVARPLNVMVSTLGSHLRFGEKALLSWIAPRGIVAAAISSLFAIKLMQAGYSDAKYLTPLTFAVIIGTVVLQSVTARPIALWLKVAEPEPRGFLIIGANLVARRIAKALTNTGVRVLLVDSGWDRIRIAKQEGLQTYLGNPISEHADHHMNLAGIGRMLALSPFESENVAAVLHYRNELGRNNMYVIQANPVHKVLESKKLPASRRGKLLFGKDVTYAQLAYAFSGDGEIRTTKLTEQFRYEKFKSLHGDKVLLLFMIDPKGRVHVCNGGDDVEPQPGWALISLFTSLPKTAK